MTKLYICTDESGDLGWTFSKPYRRGGSSRHMTISSVISTEAKRHLPKRIVKKLHQKYGVARGDELKWTDMNHVQRLEFATKTLSVVQAHREDIQLKAIVVYKQNVQQHIRADQNKLYNYMIRLSLVDPMAQANEVHFSPDPKSIKVQSGNSLHDYLQTTLWFEKQVATVLDTRPMDSKSHLNVQFADMLAGLVQTHFEDGNSDYFNVLNPVMTVKRLYFP